MAWDETALPHLLPLGPLLCFWLLVYVAVRAAVPHDDDLSSRQGSFRLARAASLRALGFLYACAFATVLWSFDGLWGDTGIQPVAGYMEQLGLRTSLSWQSRWEKFLETPTYLWLLAPSSASFALRHGCQLGLVMASLVAVGVSNTWVLALLWFLFLSTVNVGQQMLGYGWHPQLLEFGFLCIFLGRPLGLWERVGAGPPSGVVLWLLRWLLFRSMLEPGAGKLHGGDPSWWPELNALSFHYFTQPSPNPNAWLFHALPHKVHVASCIINHLVECLLPFGLLLPFRFIRHGCAMAIMAFMTVLVVSGNYAYLQYLMLAQCLCCFDDQLLLKLLPVSTNLGPSKAIATGASRLWNLCVAFPLLCVVLRASAVPLEEALMGRRASDFSYSRWHLVNGYAAFSHMTKQRPEVIIEGAASARPAEQEWLEYGFSCKVGDPLVRPCAISPLDLPLDWSLWFVPLGDVNYHPWFFTFLGKLLCNETAVVQLLATNPFPEKPPELIRVRRALYRFTSDGIDWSLSLAPLRRFGESSLRCWDAFTAALHPRRLWTEPEGIYQAPGALPRCLADAWPSETLAVRPDRPAAWWQRDFSETLVPAVSKASLLELLEVNGLPGCGPVQLGP